MKRHRPGLPLFPAIGGALLALLFVGVALAAAPTPNWVRYYPAPSGGGGADAAVKVATSCLGNVYALIQSEGTSGQPEIRLIKYDSDGATVWEKALAWGYGDIPVDLAVDADENAFLVGSTGVGAAETDRGVADPTLGNSYWLSPTAANRDWVLAKYAADGTRSWVNFYGHRVEDATAEEGDESPVALALSPEGDPVVTGYGWTNATTLSHVQTVKFDATTGTRVWWTAFDGAADGADTGRSLAVDGLGNVYVGATVYNGSTPQDDLVLLAYDEDGFAHWSSALFYDRGLNDQAVAIAIDHTASSGSGEAADEVFVAGRTQEAGYGWEWTVFAVDATSGLQEAGSETITRVAGENAEPAALAVRGSRVYVTGYSYQNATTGTDVLTRSFTRGCPGLAPEESAWHAASSGIDYATGLAVDWAGRVYVSAVANQGSASDWVTLRYNRYLDPIWNRTEEFGGDDRTMGLATDGCGAVYVAGYGQASVDAVVLQYLDDLDPPTTTPTITPTPNAFGWNSGNVTVNLTAVDDGGPPASGVSYIRYFTLGVENQAPTTVSGATADVNLTVSGITAVYFQAVDNNGNREPLDAVFIGIDRAAPGSVAVTDAPFAWGANEDGSLGIGSPFPAYVPEQVVSLSNVSKLAAGISHSLALKSDGTVWAWGRNDEGQLATGAEGPPEYAPIQTPVTGATAISAGCDHSLALLSGGTVTAWGEGRAYQLGDGSSDLSGTPVVVKDGPASTLSDVTAIASGEYHNLALKSDSTVVAWGLNDEGQVGADTSGHPDNAAPTATPVLVAPAGAALTEVTQVAAGAYHSLALKSDGTVWTWGRNDEGELGDGCTTDRANPVQVKCVGGSPLTGVIAIAGGAFHSLALKSNGTVWAWGDNSYGQLGKGCFGGQSLNPVQVTRAGYCPLTGINAIAGGGLHSLARRSNGTLVAWGAGDEGQLGDDEGLDASVAVDVLTLTNVTAFAAGERYSLAVQGGLTDTQTAASVTPAANANGWHGSDVEVTLTARDVAGGSGIKCVRYSMAGAQTAAEQEYTGPFTVDQAGVTVITFFAKDYAGNVETPKQLTIRLDKTGPTVSLSPSSVVSGGGSTGTVTLPFAAPPGGAEVLLSSDTGSATVPASVTVAEGALSADFPITTTAGSTTATAIITGTLGASQTAKLQLQGAPIIASLRATFGSGTAVIAWDTDLLADGNFDYGTTPTYGTTLTAGASNSQSHSASLTGLVAGKLYYYRARSLTTGGSPTHAASVTGTFQTPSTTTSLGYVLAREPGSIIAHVTLRNGGTTAMNSVKITRATLKGTVTENTTTTLPVSLGNLPAGSSASTTLRFPTSAGPAGTAGVLSVSWTSSAGSSSGSYRVTLP